MSNIDIDSNEAVKWISKNATKLTLNDQIKMAKVCMEFIDTAEEIYKKYNKPEPNTFFFKL